jgi:hypothetical protein
LFELDLKPGLRAEINGHHDRDWYAALLAHAEWVLYGMELGSVTLKNKQPTHTQAFVFQLNTHWQHTLAGTR